MLVRPSLRCSVAMEEVCFERTIDVNLKHTKA